MRKMTLCSPTSVQASRHSHVPLPLASQGTQGLQQDPWTGCGRLPYCDSTEALQGLAKPVCRVTRTQPI